MNSELEQRLAFYDLQGEAPRLRRIGKKVRSGIDGILSQFYDKIRSVPELAGLFTSGSHMERAKSLQKEHWLKLFENGLNDDYHARAVTIGNAHARIGLKPKWYVGAYAMVLDRILHRIIAPGVSGLLPWRRAAARDAALLVKAALVDMDLALSTYFDKNEQDIRDVVDRMSSALRQLADGDLTIRLSDMPSEFGQAQNDFNAALEGLADMMQRISASASSVSTGAAEIRAASDDLALRNEQQAASLEETAAAMNQVTGIVRETAKGAGDVQRSINEAHEEATEGGVVVRRAIEGMAAIERSSEEISQIINVIDGIAFQTNLLALNAGVEAARAGDAGKGFAVVANEVRALAQRSADAAKDIKVLITASTGQVANGVTLVGETGTLLEKIVTRVGSISTLITDIAHSTDSQATKLQQVNSAVGDMDRMTQQNAAMVEQSTAASRTLAEEAKEMTALVGQFRTGGIVVAAPVRSARPAARRAAAPRVQGNLAIKQTDHDWSEF